MTFTEKVERAIDKELLSEDKVDKVLNGLSDKFSTKKLKQLKDKQKTKKAKKDK